MDMFEESAQGVGTYLKVIRFSEPTNPDGFVVLYLRPKGVFLFLGYWCGYERTVVAGRWSRQGSILRLEGRGRMQTDSLAKPKTPVFARVFTTTDENHTPTLSADTGLEEWSLLGWTGPFMYAGLGTIIAPDDCWLPRSLPAVDAWIRELVGV